MRIEVRLRVPNMKVRALDPQGYPIDHSEVRFRKTVDVSVVPKANETLELSTRSGFTFPALVVRNDFYEAQGYVVSCQFGRRAITPDEYHALANDPDWTLKHLLD